MKARLNITFFYKDYTSYNMLVDIPTEVADKIHVAGLVSTKVLVQSKIGSADSQPKFDDFKKEDKN